jgi:hypothetical protein
MLGFYKDVNLTLPVNSRTPKRFLLPLAGGSRTSALWLGDPYSSKVTAQASAGATSLSLDQTFEFPTYGTVTVNAQTLTYTGKTISSLTGIPASGTGSIASTIAIGSIVVPSLTYIANSVIRVDSAGSDLDQTQIQLKRSNQGSYNFANTGVLFTSDRIGMGVANALEVDMKVLLNAGAQEEFQALSVVANAFATGDNLLLSSEAFDSSIWAKTNANITATANTTVAPDGTTTADTLTDNDAAVDVLIGQTATTNIPADNQTYVASIHLKAGTATVCAIRAGLLNGSGASTAIAFNPTNGQYSVSSVGSAPAWAVITSLASGWWRLSFPVTNDGTNTQIRLSVRPATAAALAGNGLGFTTTHVTTSNGTVIAWGAQVHRGNAVKPYLPTTTSFAFPGRQDVAVTAAAPIYVFRRDQALPEAMRLLPLTREVQPALPGFVVGQYRWRDKEQANANFLLPTQWDPDITKIGEEKFVSGYAHGSDLEPVDLEESNDSLYLRVRDGSYFSGPSRFFLPADYALEFFQASAPGTTTFHLASVPREEKPLYVGTWRLDGQGFYEKDTEYRYMCNGLSTENGSPTYQFVVQRGAQQLSINTAPVKKVLYLGLISGKQTDYFDLPVYPVDRVNRVYIDRGLNSLALDATNWTFDREQGTLKLINPNSSTAGPSIPNALAGEAIFAEVDAAVAVLYETGTADDRLITQADINPAFSGLAGGYLYLQHRRQRPDHIELSVDKPVIAIPPTHDTVIGLTAYGPVYFDGDYALLIAKAFSPVPDEIVPGARLRVVIDPLTFTGLINYKDPLTQTVEVVTGGDGTANLIYTPKSGYGTWDPSLQTVTNYALQSEALNVSPWNNKIAGSATNPTVTANATADPNGNVTAEKIDFPIVAAGTGNRSGRYQTTSGMGTVASRTFTGSIWLRADVPCSINLLVEENSSPFNGTTTPCSVTTVWQRFQTTKVFAGSLATAVNLELRNGGVAGGAPAASLYAWGAQVEVGSPASPYIPTTTVAVTTTSFVTAQSPITTGSLGGVTGSATFVITSAVRSSNAVTITTSTPHGLYKGASVTIIGVTNSTFEGTFATASVPSPTTFTYAQNLVDASSSGGTARPNNILVLPATVPISQVRNDKEGWLVTVYPVFNNNPLFGLVGGLALNGEVPFITTGTPGTSTYQTNGMRDAWRSGDAIVRPMQALDAAGNNYTAGPFSGSVKQLQFATALPSTSNVGSYFVSYVQRVTVQLQAADSNVLSNTILLEMAVPSVIVENPWLVLDDDVQGRVNQFRLGWVRSSDKVFVPPVPPSFGG